MDERRTVVVVLRPLAIVNVSVLPLLEVRRDKLEEMPTELVTDDVENEFAPFVVARV